MKYLDELEELNLPKNKFAVFGSGSLAIRGLREANDLDIIVKEDLWEELEKKFKVEDQENPVIKVKNIEIYKSWKPWFDDINELIDKADIIQGLRFVKLDKVLEWKKKMGREKDLKDIKLIKELIGRFGPSI